MSTGNLYWLPSKPYHHFETVLLPLPDDGATMNRSWG